MLSTTIPLIQRFTTAHCRNILHTLEHLIFRPTAFTHLSLSVNGASVSDITIDTAADVPCVSATFIRRHVTLDANHVRPVPSEAINLHSADGPVLEVVGYIRFDLTLGRTTLPIEPLVLPRLGPGKVILENSIMGAFGAVLDWSVKTLTFRTDHVSVPAIHRRASAPD